MTDVMDESTSVKEEATQKLVEGSNIDESTRLKEEVKQELVEGSNEEQKSKDESKKVQVEESNEEQEPKDENEEELITKSGDAEEGFRGPLDYTDRKVIVDNVLKFVKPNQLKAMMESWVKGHEGKIKIAKHKKPANNNWVLVTLEHENMVEDFIAEMNSGNHKNKKGGDIRAYKAADKNRHNNQDDRDNRGKRGASDDGGDASSSKKPRLPPKECVKTVEEVRDIITPLWRLPYERQLIGKSREMSNKCLAKITKEIQFKVRTLNKEAKKQKKAPIPLYRWVDKRRAVEMQKIIAAPKRTEYRNKCELTFGYRHNYSTSENEQDVIVKTPALGFMAGGWSGGVSDPHCLSNIPDEVCGVADIFNNFLQSSSIPPYDAKSHRGVWRQLTIRSSKRTNECMLIILHAPASGGAGKRDDGSDDYTENFDSQKARLIQMLTEGTIPKPLRNLPDEISSVDNGAPPTAGEDCDSKTTDLKDTNTMDDGSTQSAKEECDVKTMDLEEDTKIVDDGASHIVQEECNSKTMNMKVTSIFFQSYAGLSNPSPDHPVQHVFGKTSMDEKLGKCIFQISPGAFFQVTTEGAEVLYDVVVKNVKEVTENPKDTVLFDVCCGTGTIGLTCMKEGAVGKVVGIDISEPAIKDAKINAEKNGYSGSDDVARFVASRAELVMAEETRKVDCAMVAVVDPARDGLHSDVLRALRNKRKIQRIVYVSCNPTGSLIKDAAAFCAPPTKKYREAPFKITSAQPVDMFPYTPHCEMVLVFDRMTEEELAIENATESVK